MGCDCHSRRFGALGIDLLVLHIQATMYSNSVFSDILPYSLR